MLKFKVESLNEAPPPWGRVAEARDGEGINQLKKRRYFMLVKTNVKYLFYALIFKSDKVSIILSRL